MYFTIKTTASTKDFTIPFATSGNCPAQIVVNWGDGSSTTVNEGQSLSTTTFKHSYNSYDTTYRITVNSAQKDVTKVQVPEFNFGKYPSNTSSNSNKNENGELLYSVDSPVLYSGVTSLASMFYGADNLTSVSGSTFILYPDVTSMNNVFGAYSNGKLANIPTDLFTNNTKVTNFSWAFGYQTKLTTIPAGLFDKNVNAASFGSIFNNCTALTTVPAGLFDKNINVTDMNRVFRACTSLQSVPKGIFAKNIKVTNFVAVFAHDKKLKLNSEIFIDDTYTKTNRFTYVSSMIDFMWAFQNVGLDYLDNGQDGGEMPDLWNYTYTSNGVGVTTRGNAVYNYDLDGDNIFNDYPSHFSNWRSSGAYDIRSSGWFIGSNNKYSPTVLKKN